MHLNRGNLLNCHLKGKTCNKLANEQNIDYSEKDMPHAIIIKHVYWYTGLQQISGEPLQDNLSSGIK